jgi:stress-induced morphogen
MDLLKEVEKRMKTAFADGEVELDFADGKHMEVEIKSGLFAGKNLVEQHKMVYAAVQDLMNDGYLHALKIKTLTK